jgi:hypothetical protein
LNWDVVIDNEIISFRFNVIKNEVRDIDTISDHAIGSMYAMQEAAGI